MSISETTQGIPSTIALTERDDAAKTHAFIAYGLMFAGLFTFFISFIAVIWAMVKKSDAKASIFADHYSNIIKTFFLGLLFYFIATACLFAAIFLTGKDMFFPFVFGFLMILPVWLWTAYRIIKGIAKLTSNKSYG
jgi:uncharacterized membrane protein